MFPPSPTTADASSALRWVLEKNRDAEVVAVVDRSESTQGRTAAVEVKDRAAKGVETPRGRRLKLVLNAMVVIVV